MSGKAVIGEKEILLLYTAKRYLHEAVESLGLGAVSKKESGEPYFENGEYCISFSHKGDLGVAAVSRARVGVDVEDVNVPRNVARLSRLFDESEKPESLYDFYKVWTGKEAMGKYDGTGITYDVLNTKATDVRHLDYGDYLIGVVGKGEITLKVF